MSLTFSNRPRLVGRPLLSSADGFSYFTPVIVQNFGYSPIKTQLLTVPPFFLAFLVTLVNARISDRYGQRGLCAILMSILALVGYISA